MLKKGEIARLHQAAQIIHDEEFEGVREAMALVGEQTAVALLIADQRRTLGQMDDLEGMINIALTRAGLIGSVQLAVVNLTASQALVCEGEERVLLLKADEPGKPEDATGMNRSMLFDGCQLLEVPAGKPPYTELYNFLRLNALKRLAGDLILIALDGSADESTRREAVEELNPKLADPSRSEKLKRFLRTNVFRAEVMAHADLKGFPRIGIAGELVAEYEQKQASK